MDVSKDRKLLLEAKKLSFSYGENLGPVFSDLSLSIYEGESILLMGASGCGKSSLAYCLAGLYPEYAGQLDGDIFIGGKPINHMGACERSQNISILFQNPDNQFCMEKVNQEILFALENINYSGDLYARMEYLLDYVELRHVKDEPIHTLSGGTKQKIAIATALATEANMLILDEPLANLDPESSILVVNMLKKLHEDGLTILIIDHKPNMWRSFIDNLILMDNHGNLNNKRLDPRQLERHRDEFNKRGIFLNDDWLLDYEPIDIDDSSIELVELENVGIAYDKKKILSEISFKLKKASVTVIVGRNGSGKTSLLLAMADVLRHKGKIDIKGEVGLVFQNPRFQFLTLSVEDEIIETLKVIRPDATEEMLMEEAQEFLNEFGLLKWREASPYELSQGQQRRLALLSMLAGERSLLLLDEPTYAQDEKATRFILDLLKKKVEDGLTTVISTHDLAMAKAIANRVFLVKNGQVVELSPQKFDEYIEERNEAI